MFPLSNTILGCKIFSVLIFSLLTFVDAGPSEENFDSSTQTKYEALSLIEATVQIKSTYPYFNQERLIIDEDAYIYDATEIKEKVIYLCPAEEQKDINLLKRFIGILKGIEYCLFEKPVEENANICLYEVQPLLSPNYDILCEASSGKSYIFEFNYCYTIDDIKDYEKFYQKFASTDFKQVYEICFEDNNEKVIWTRHTPMTPRFNGAYRPISPPSDDELLQSNAQLQPDKISLESYTMNDELFSRKYQEFQELMETSTVPVALHTLVPEAHMPSKVWAKAVTHMINLVPVSQDIIPLINAIDMGIKKIAFYIQSLATILNILLDGSNLKQKYTLDIYTTTFSKRMDSPIPDGWCKFIYFKPKRLGILIFIHTTPNQTPDKIGKHCSNMIGVGNEVDCKFTTWFKSEDPIVNKLTQYAYCCRATKSLLQKLFSFQVEVNDYLNVGEIMNKNYVELNKLRIKTDEIKTQYLQKVDEVLNRFK